MLKMAQVQYIKYLYENEEKSLREIARETQISLPTVTKYAYMENWSADRPPNVEPNKHPVLGDYIHVIDEWLETDRRMPRKQRHTVKRIFDRLRDEYEYHGSYSSVKKYVRKKKFLMRQRLEGNLPLEHPKGHAQVDFGEISYFDSAGVMRTAYELAVSFPYSNRGFVQVFPAQNQECLLEGLKRIFAHIGGTPLRLRCDNMSTAVAQILDGSERVLTDGFSRFMLQYRFAADFCNPASGNEKGNVENKVGYSRRNFFVPVPTILSFEDFNEQLWKTCERDSHREHYMHHIPISELWDEERACLLTLPEYEYHVFRYETLRVDKTGFVSVETNKYGLTPDLSGELVDARIFFDRIEFSYDHSLLKTYARSYGQSDEVMDWTQYVDTLCRKPGAVEHTRFFDQIPKLWQKHLRETSGTERKSALLLLSEIVHDGNAGLCDDVLMLASDCGRIDADSLKQCYCMIAKKEFRPQPLKLNSQTPVLDYAPDLSAYDCLTGGESGV